MSPAVSAKEFLDASMLFCDDYALLNSRAGVAQESPLFTGHLGTRTLSSGINLSTAQITALSDSDHAAIFPRSLSIVLSLEGQASEFDPGNGHDKIMMRPGEAAFFSFSDDAQTKGRYSLGHRCKSVLIQLRHGAISEESLAEFVDDRSRSSSIVALGANKRLNALSLQLFNPDLCGTVGCLLIESHVLELVARAIQAAGQSAIEGNVSLKGTDRVRMARVREMLIEQPGLAHSLTSLAREAGVSVSGLKVKFREVYGQSVFSFLHEVRMERARTGIVLEGWTVMQAAHFAGYRHASNFSTAFQRHFGHSPGCMAHVA